MISADVLFRRAVTQKRRSVREEPLCGFPVKLCTLRLIKWPFIPIHAEPLQAFKNSVYQFRFIALGVGVLNAQDHRAVIAPGEKPVEERGAGAAHMQIAGGGRGEPHARLVWGCVRLSSHKRRRISIKSQKFSVANREPGRKTPGRLGRGSRLCPPGYPGILSLWPTVPQYGCTEKKSWTIIPSTLFCVRLVCLDRMRAQVLAESRGTTVRARLCKLPIWVASWRPFLRTRKQMLR